MERFAPVCSVVLLERLDTPVTRFILSYPDFSHLFRAKVSAYLLSWRSSVSLASGHLSGSVCLWLSLIF